MSKTILTYEIEVYTAERPTPGDADLAAEHMGLARVYNEEAARHAWVGYDLAIDEVTRIIERLNLSEDEHYITINVVDVSLNRYIVIDTLGAPEEDQANVFGAMETFMASATGEIESSNLDGWKRDEESRGSLISWKGVRQ